MKNGYPIDDAFLRAYEEGDYHPEEFMVPGHPDQCLVEDECCDECDYFLECFPDWKKNIEEAH